MKRGKGHSLVTSGGLNGANVRAVSYGEDRNRQVRSGATGEAGRDNHCVALVVDYAGPMAAPAAQPTASATP